MTEKTAESDFGEQLEAWAAADPRRRAYSLARFAHPECTDRVRCYLTDGVRFVWAYDCEPPDRPQREDLLYLGTRERRATAAEVVAGAIRRWEEIHGGN